MALPIAIGNTATTFANGEFTVSAGAPASLFITSSVDGDIPAGVDFQVALKTAGAKYTILTTLNAGNILEKGMILPPATYAARRLLGSASAGLELKA